MTTKAESVEIAVLQTQMTEVKTQLSDFGKAQSEGFATLNTKLDTVTPLIPEVASHTKEIELLKKQVNKSWVKNTGSALVGALLFFLVQYALTHQ